MTTTYDTPKHTIKEAATQLQVSIDTIRRRLRRGDLRGEMIDGKWMVELPSSHPPSPYFGSDQLVQILVSQLEATRTENARLLGIMESVLTSVSENRAAIARLIDRETSPET